MSNTYYEYEKVKVKIAHRLFNMDGWTVYGWHNDNSDPMTDYYDPAYWDGIAEKNGYRLVVDKSYSRKDTTETRVRYNNGNLSRADIEKIKKLEQMTQERGASEQEEQTARAAIEKIKNRVEEGREEYTVFTPGHMANPPRCNWHIEKDGIIYDKGTGLLKFYGVPDITNENELKEWQEFNTKSREKWIEDEAADEISRWNESEERAREIAESRYNSAEEKYALLEKFNLLIARFNNVCGGMVGNAGTETYTYEEITVTEYKTELKPVEKPGEIREGQCFILKASFNYGYQKGYVYRIHKSYVRTDGKQAYKAYRLGKGYKKERTGNSTPSNEWSIYNTDDLMKWVNKGVIAFCELEEVKTPYEVKKVVKKYHKTEQEETTAEEAPQETETAAQDQQETEPETISARISAQEEASLEIVPAMLPASTPLTSIPYPKSVCSAIYSLQTF
jgi:flagellar hook protein FlgE